MTRAMIDRLPATNWCKRAVDLFPIYDGLDDAEIHELFLSQQQSVFSIPDVWELLDAVGLFLVEHTREQRALCEPQFAFPDGPLLKQVVLRGSHKVLTVGEIGAVLGEIYIIRFGRIPSKKSE